MAVVFEHTCQASASSLAATALKIHLHSNNHVLAPGTYEPFNKTVQKNMNYLLNQYVCAIEQDRVLC